MSAHLVTVIDEQLGVIAAAVDDEGNIVATSAAMTTSEGVVILDESSTYEATGELLPPNLWDACEDDGSDS